MIYYIILYNYIIILYAKTLVLIFNLFQYLQGKRGIEKPAFDLPAFIKRTGIMEMRASLQDKDESRSLKSKMRERARPKMGRIDIDYQKLHDAFFKYGL